MISSNLIAGVTVDKLIRVWDINTGEEVKLIVTSHTDTIFTIIKLNNNQVATGSLDSTIKIWNISDWTNTKTLTGHTGTVYILLKLNENEIASGSLDKTIKIWNLTTGLENLLKL